MACTIYDARRIKAYDGFTKLCEYAGKDESFATGLWIEIVSDDLIMQEYMYYLEHHCFKDAVCIEGFSLTDIYMWLLARYNLLMLDYGKNGDECNKEALVLDSFKLLTDLKHEPEKYAKILNDPTNLGMDIM